MKPHSRESGAVLVIVMMTMLGLLGLGLTALWITSGNLHVGGNMNQRMQALYAAEAGVERARAILNSAQSPVNVNNELAGSNHLLDRIPTTLNTNGLPAGIGAVMTDPSLPAGNQWVEDVPFPPPTMGRNQGTAQNPTAGTMGSYTVWIRNDNADLRLAASGFPNLWTQDSGNGSVVVRSRGMAADRRTTVTLEVALGSIPGTQGGMTGGVANVPLLCNAGKNSCDDNNSVISGVVAD